MNNKPVNISDNVKNINRLSNEQKATLIMAYQNRKAMMDAVDQNEKHYDVIAHYPVDMTAYDELSEALTLMHNDIKKPCYDDSWKHNYYYGVNGMYLVDLMFKHGVVNGFVKHKFTGRLLFTSGKMTNYFTSILNADDYYRDKLKEEIYGTYKNNFISTSDYNPIIVVRENKLHWQIPLFRFDNKDDQQNCVNILTNKGVDVVYSLPDEGKSSLDLTLPEVMADVYGLRPYLISGADKRNRLGSGQCFNREAIGKERYNNIIASASRLLKRLEQRGLCYRDKHKDYLSWTETGIVLTEIGRSMAKYLIEPKQH